LVRISWHLSQTQRLFHKSLSSICVSVYVSSRIVVRQRLGRHVTLAANTRNNRRIVGGVVFCAVHVVSKEGLWMCLCIPLSLLGIGSVNTFPLQRKIVGDLVFYAVRVVSKKSRRLVLPRTSCLLFLLIVSVNYWQRWRLYHMFATLTVIQNSTLGIYLLFTLLRDRERERERKKLGGANAELVPKFHVALHASHAALPMVTSQFRPNIALPTLDPILLMQPFQRHIKKIYIHYKIPIICVTYTRRTSGHCLGTFKTGDIVSCPPPPQCSVSHIT
jgi:hypothetical protein